MNMLSLKIAIVGGRDFDDYELLKKRVDELVAVNPNRTIIIVSGGARGADSLAERYADERGFKKKVFPADWDRFGKSAGYKRNMQIVVESDCVIAFWDGVSKGTNHTITIAKKNRRPLIVVSY